jgi:hypothetical protein
VADHGRQFPHRRENTGKSGFAAFSDRITVANSLFFRSSVGKFPKRANRELNRSNRELNRPNRELNPACREFN